MGYVIHCRATPAGKRYRAWSTNSDTYATQPLTWRGIRDFLLDDIRKNAEQTVTVLLQLAEYRGSTDRGDGRGPDEDWRQERCTCGCYHHEYEGVTVWRTGVGTEPRGPGTACCSTCGESREYAAHRPPCQKS